MYFLTVAVSRQENLSVNSVLQYLDPMSDQWVVVATKLGVFNSVINSIQVSRLDNHASLRRVVEWWFQYTANPDWGTVGKILQGKYRTLGSISTSR